MSVKVKICGVNDLDSLKASSEAEFVGFVFYPKSPRFINAEGAQVLSRHCNPKQKKVGLFVNTNDSVVEYISDFVNLDYIQLHGNESVEKIKYFKQKLNRPIIKSISVNEKKDVEKSKIYKDICDMILFDTKSVDDELPGGNGLTFNWNYLKDFKSKPNWMLAGGICKENYKKALKITKAPILDVSSCLEKKKGVKCPKKIKEFLELVKLEKV